MMNLYLPSAASLRRVVALAARSRRRNARLALVRWTAAGVCATDGHVAYWIGDLVGDEAPGVTLPHTSAAEVLGLLALREQAGREAGRPILDDEGNLEIEGDGGVQRFAGRRIPFPSLARVLDRYLEPWFCCELGAAATRILRSAIPRTLRRRGGERLTHAVGIVVTDQRQLVVRAYHYDQSPSPAAETAIPARVVYCRDPACRTEVLLDPEVLRFALTKQGSRWTLSLRDEFSPISLESPSLRSVVMPVRP